MNAPQTLAERAAAIAAQARSYADAKGTDKQATAPDTEPTPSESPKRWHWIVYRPNGVASYTILDEPLTQAEVRARFPESLGAVPW